MEKIREIMLLNLILKVLKKSFYKKQQENSLLLFFLNHRADFVSYVVEVIKPNITH